MGNNQTYKQYTREKTEDRLNIKEEELNIEEKRLAIKRKRLTTKEKELQNKEEELKTKENRPKHVFYACVLIGGFIYFVSTKDFSQVDYTPRNITTNTRGISTSNLPSKRKSAGTGAPCYLTKFRDSCRLNSFTYAANGRCPERPASVTTTHKSRFVITPSNGWTAIRNAILASLARYRALRLSELPCRLSGTKNHHFASAPFP